MKKYVVTYTDMPAWKSWGAYWVSSLWQFANFDGQAIVIFRDELPSKHIIDRLAENNVIVIPALNISERRMVDLVPTLTNAIPQIDEDGVYIYWGVDSYFENDINPLFDKSADCMVYCDFGQPCEASLVSENSVPSNNMIGGPARLWKVFGGFSKFFRECYPDVSLHDYLANFAKHFPRFINKQDVVWNCDLPSVVKLVDDKLYKGHDPVRVFCPTVFQSLAALKGLNFYQRHPSVVEGWQRWLYGQPSYKKVLFKVNGPLPLWDDRPAEVANESSLNVD
jgi:hypothetical protein